MEKKIQALAKLLMDTGHAHHQAYIEVDGNDPDWAVWYADQLYDKLPEHLSVTLHKSNIIYLLMHLSYVQALDAPQAQWPPYYAKYLLQRYG